jgi:hypothetical protein
MKKSCEYCRNYEKDYTKRCWDCRVDGGPTDYSMFRWNKTIKRLRKLARLGKVVRDTFDDGYTISVIGLCGALAYPINTEEEMLDWGVRS